VGSPRLQFSKSCSLAMESGSFDKDMGFLFLLQKYAAEIRVFRSRMNHAP
jgi:hypothetical protein